MIRYFQETAAGRREVSREHVLQVFHAYRCWTEDRDSLHKLQIETLERNGKVKVSPYRTFYAEREAPEGGNGQV